MTISIIIPTWNEAATIEKLVEALKDEIYEVIVADDGGEDNTAGLPPGPLKVEFSARIPPSGGDQPVCRGTRQAG